MSNMIRYLLERRREPNDSLELLSLAWIYCQFINFLKVKASTSQERVSGIFTFLKIKSQERDTLW